MRRNLFIVLVVIFTAELGVGANNVVLNCPCQLKSSCFKPLDISKVNETTCSDETFVRCCVESEPFVKQIVVISSTTSTEPKYVNNVSVIFPSEMSGIPQTTPSNMPDDYMIHMLDRETGNQMLLVFPKHEEITSEEPTTTTTSTTPSPPTTTTTLKPTEIPTSQPTTTTVATTTAATTTAATTTAATTTAASIRQNIVKPKPKRISGKRRIVNRRKQHGQTVEQKHETLKPNAKIYDVSRRKNFLRRYPDTPLDSFDPIIPPTRPTTTQTPVVLQHAFNNELRIKIDQEHKTMIETLKAVLIANDNSPLRRPLDTGKSQRFKSMEGLVNVEMAKVINNMRMQKKPYRGKIKYQDYKWAAIPDSHQEQHITTTTKRPITTPKSQYNFPSLPYNEFENGPTLLADFKPSPLWSLQAENIEIIEVNTRNPRRRYVSSPFEYVGAESGFVPVVHNGESLQIVGPVPDGFKSTIDDSRLNYELPAQEDTNF